MSADDRPDRSGNSDDCGSNSEDEISGEHVISSTEEYQPPYYEHVEENEYLFDRKTRVNKEVRKMQCDCTYEADQDGFIGCGENCLNRLLMIECNSRCTCGVTCSNKRFQQGCKVKVEVLKTYKKGWGLRTLEDLEPNQFVMEYCGEVMDYRDFQERAELYDRENRRHYYFMTLRADEIIDATFKGNLSRFINHSCDPNCETQKWTVNGLLRIGFFTLKHISAGTELTFDYKLQRYGKVAQVCYCEAYNCRGFIGGEKQTPLKNTVERIATPPTSSPRRRQRKKRNLTADFDDITLEDEVEKLLGDNRGLVQSDQALKLSRLMVRAETTDQRIMLLKILQHTTDQACLKAFLRFQGLSLLWSWMVDGGGKKARLQSQLLETLRCLPIATKNQLEDSKVIKVVRKWAMLSCRFMESGCSIAQDNDSPTDSECTAGPEDDDEKDKKVSSSPFFERQCSNKDQSDDDSLDAEVASFTVEKGQNGRFLKGKIGPEKSPDDLSEDDIKSEDERLPTDGVGVMANELLKSWSLLKEVYKIPKKSATPAKQDRIVELSLVCSPAGSTEGEHSRRTPCEQISSPGRLDIIMKTLHNSPRPLFPVESRTPPVSEGFSTCSEHTLVEKVYEDEAPKPKPADFSLLEFGEVTESKETSTFDEKEDEKDDTNAIHPAPDSNQSSQNTKSQISMQTFGYQQRMNFNMYQGFGCSFQQKPRGSKKKKKKWNQNQSFFQQQDRNVHGSGKVNANLQANFNQQQGMAPWRGSSQSVQNVSQNFQGNQAFCGGPMGLNQGPRPQNMVPGNLAGNMSQQAPSFPNFSVPPPNIPPMEFFRKIPPPNFPQQNQPVIVPQIQQNPVLPQQTLPLPHLPPNQPTFFPVNQQPPFNRLPPPPPFQSNISAQASPQFPQGNTLPQPQQLQQVMQSSFPSQPSKFPALNSSTVPHLNILPAQQVQSVSPQGQVTMAIRHPGNTPEASSVSEVESLMLQTGVVTTSSLEMYEHRDKPEPSTPLPVKCNLSQLPPYWKAATDPQGKVYYYHTQTRKTQWELPRWDNSPSSEEEPIMGPEGTSFATHSYHSVEELSSPKAKLRKLAKTPSTPPGTPPESPTLAYITAAADTTAHRRDEDNMDGEGSSTGSTTHFNKVKEMFRMKLSNVVVNCLNPFFKVDCKAGRILNTEDFKYLARKLTHGILMKELSHLKSEETLHCNDSVKIKTKEYIRTYMKKFGPVYKRT